MRSAPTVLAALFVGFSGADDGELRAVERGETSPPIVWKPPATFSEKAPGLGLPTLEGVAHWLIYDPLPSKANVDEGGDGRFESLRHGTFNHHQEIVLHEENLEPPAGSKPAGGWRTSKLIVFWTNHSRDENGPGQRVLAKVGTFNADRTEIVWGDDETLVELAPAPVPVRRRLYDSDPEVIREVKASAALRRINGRLYVVGSLNAWHGRTDDVKYHGTYGKPIPAEHWSDRYDRAKGFQWDVAWPLGLKFAQRWKVEGGRLVPDSPLYKMSEPVAKVEVTPGRFKRVEALIEPYTSARPFSEAPAEMQEDVLRGQPERFSRNPKYAPGTSKLAADGKNGLAH
ncbi:MAG: hypothetical protein FJ272_10540, partial [Planctomycetes bacterium]|nr:hypothetical protein [Planctomycetota bacterium]